MGFQPVGIVKFISSMGFQPVNKSLRQTYEEEQNDGTAWNAMLQLFVARRGTPCYRCSWHGVERHATSLSFHAVLK